MPRQRPARINVYPYKLGSRSAKALSVALGGKVLKHVGSKFRPRHGDVVVNWGASNVPDFGPATTLNADVSVAQCKLASFRALEEAEVSVPVFCTTIEDAKLMKFPVVCRTKLRGHSGDGIVIADTAEELVPAPLYTQYTKKKDEYRVHVTRKYAGHVDGEPNFLCDSFFIQRKARKLEVENPNWQVRNLAGGFVFVEVEADEVPEAVLSAAEDTIEALNLTFGGVDVMWNEREGKAYVLECNTACGLEERTAAHYSDAIRNLNEAG